MTYNIAAVTVGKQFPTNFRFLICEMVWQPVRNTEKSNELVYKVFTIHSKHLINTSHGHIINYNVIELWSNIQYYAWLNRLHKEILVSRCWLPHLYITQCSISCLRKDRFTHKPMAPGPAVLKVSSSLSPPFSVFSETFHSQFSLWPSSINDHCLSFIFTLRLCSRVIKVCWLVLVSLVF